MKRNAGKYALLALAGLAAWPVNTLAARMGTAGQNALCAVVLAAWVAGVFVWKRKNRSASFAGSIAALGFALGLIFVIKLPHSFSMHDLAGYELYSDGHLGFIAYLVQKGALPLDNPMDPGCSVFYNPPLHHLIHACFLKLNLAFGASLETGLENLQLITLVCASACTLLTIDLMRLLKVKERGVETGALFMAAQPSLLIFGATVNNDIQSVMFVLAALLFTVRWHRTRRMRDILCIGVTLGCAMATKLSTALIIPCIAAVFAVAFFQNLRSWKTYVGQFAAFLAVSVPEAVAWPLFHLIAYQMPLNYVRLPSELILLDRYTFWQRFGIPNHAAIRGLFYSGIRKIDHNVWMQTLKTAMFDELTLFAEGTVQWYAAYFTMVLFAALLVLALAMGIRWLLSKRADGMTRLFIAGYAVILIGQYLLFCQQYPYVCSFNFRYIMPVLSLCAFMLGDAVSSLKRGKWLITLPVAAFAVLVIVLYGTYFFGNSLYAFGV